VICHTVSPHTLRETLALAYGIEGRVRKQRIIFNAGKTRFHLDTAVSFLAGFRKAIIAHHLKQKVCCCSSWHTF